jgi:hypothetical protein
MRLVGPLAVGLVLLLSRPASAADKQIRPFVALAFAGSTTFVDLATPTAADKRHGMIGVQGAALGNILGIEVDAATASGFFETKPGFGNPALVLHSRLTTVTGSVVVAAPRKLTEYTLRPYFIAGAGAMRVTQVHPFGVLPVSDTVAVYNLGGGAIGFLTARVGVGWDVRRFSTVKGAPPPAPVTTGGRLAFWRASMALVIRY